MYCGSSFVRTSPGRCGLAAGRETSLRDLFILQAEGHAEPSAGSHQLGRLYANETNAVEWCEIVPR
jgi:hypothetical protein